MKRRILFLAIIFIFNLPQSVLADSDGSQLSIFAENVTTYDNWNADNTKQLGSLQTSSSLIQGLLSGIVDDPNTNWNQVWYSQGDAWQTDWVSEDSTYADNSDLAVYCGHGYPANNYALDTNITSWNVYSNYLNLGDRDCEWLLTFTCKFLNGDVDNFGYMAKGLHSVCGYKTD
ncbi:MAG: DUF6345 domain-containing protein, partial [Bacillota bacterium]|nr:DUF6345 domain-containing protein [Bacillota bacterium]